MADSTSATLQTIRDTIVVKEFHDLDILEKVNGFYIDSWDRLIVTVSIAFGIVGIIVPLIIQWYQKRKLELETEKYEKGLTAAQANLKSEIEKATAKLNEDFEKKMLDTKDELTKDFEGQLTKKFKKTEDEFEKIRLELMGHLHHLQGADAISDKDYKSALYDFLKAADYNIKLGSTNDLFADIKNITLAIKKLGKYTMVTQIEDNAGLQITGIIQRVKDRHGEYRIEDLQELEKVMEKLKKTSAEESNDDAEEVTPEEE